MVGEQRRGEASHAQLKLQLAAYLQRVDELQRAVESERTSALEARSEANSSHAAEVLQLKKALKQMRMCMCACLFVNE